MKSVLFGLAGWLTGMLVPHPASAHVREIQLTLKSSYRLEKEPLTTDRVAEIDPDQSNPHLQKWTLGHHAELVGLKGVPLALGKWGVNATAVVSVAQGFVRGSGPWYRPFREFGCEKSPQSWFSTDDGAKYAVAKAAALWSSVLKEEKFKLEFLLGRVTAASKDSALFEGDQIFQDWLRALDLEWRSQASRDARLDEWNGYLKEAATQGICPPSPLNAQKGLPVHSPTLKSMLEPIPNTPTPQVTELLARAPVRLWNGLFSVRLNLKVGDRTLNGRFLIDSGARKSIISPTWLEGQGIYAALIELPKAPPERVTWSGQWPALGLGGLAPQARINHVELSGLELPLHDFLISETDFFAPPDHAGSCCDGVLGSDFLKLFPMEFQSSLPSEIRVWPRKNFHWSAETPWVVVNEIEQRGTLESSCSLDSVLDGAQWATGLEGGIMVHTPWQKKVEKTLKEGNLFCDSIPIATAFPLSNPKKGVGSQLTARVPSLSLGMSLLSRGNFTFDLPHGRLWFSKESLGKGEVGLGHSGLHLGYEFEQGERILKVKSIEKGSPAAELVKDGLKVGSILTQIDMKAPVDIDLWEVNRRLAGYYGPTVSLQWRTKEGLKMAPLSVQGHQN